MKCSIIRDLLPLYGTHKCRKETKELVTKHLESCKNCREIYEAMREEVGLKSSMHVHQAPLPYKSNIVSSSSWNLQQGNERVEGNSFSENYQKNNEDAEFWSKYYAAMLIKGIKVFLLIYIFIILLRVIFIKL